VWWTEWRWDGAAAPTVLCGGSVLTASASVVGCLWAPAARVWLLVLGGRSAVVDTDGTVLLLALCRQLAIVYAMLPLQSDSG